MQNISYKFYKPKRNTFLTYRIKYQGILTTLYFKNCPFTFGVSNSLGLVSRELTTSRGKDSTRDYQQFTETDFKACKTTRISAMEYKINHAKTTYWINKSYVYLIKSRLLLIKKISRKEITKT